MPTPPLPATLAEVEAFDSGALLDALVAQTVLGHQIAWDDDAFLSRHGLYGFEADGRTRPVPRFSTDTLAAEVLVQAILARTGAFALRGGTSGWYALSHYPDDEASHPAGNLEFVRLERAASRAHAICRCALRLFVLNDSGPTEDEKEAAQDEWGNWAESQGS